MTCEAPRRRTHNDTPLSNIEVLNRSYRCRACRFQEIETLLGLLGEITRYEWRIGGCSNNEIFDTRAAVRVTKMAAET